MTPGRHRVAQVGTGEAVPGHPGPQLADQVVDGQVLEPLRPGQAELPAEVDEHLVAARRRPTEQLVHRLVAADLVGPDAGLDGQHHPERAPGVDLAVLDRRCPPPDGRWLGGRGHNGRRGRSVRSAPAPRALGGVSVELAVELDVGEDRRAGVAGERGPGQVGQHRVLARPDLDQTGQPRQRRLRLHPPHRVGQLVGQQLDQQPAGVGGRCRCRLPVPASRSPTPVCRATSATKAGSRENGPADQVGHPPIAPAGRGRPRGPAPPGGPGRRVPPGPWPRSGRGCRSRETTCPFIRRPRAAMATSVPAMAYWRPATLWLTTSSSSPVDRATLADQAGHLVEVEAGGLGVDDGQPVGGPAAGVPGDLGLLGQPPPPDQLEGDLQGQDAEGDEGAVLARAVAAGDEPAVAPELALVLQLGHLGRGQGDQGHLGHLRAEQHAGRVAYRRPVGQPQGERVVVDHLQQGEAEAGTGEGVGCRPHGAGGGRPRPAARHPCRAPAPPGRGRAGRWAAGRRGPRRWPRPSRRR